MLRVGFDGGLIVPGTTRVRVDGFDFGAMPILLCPSCLKPAGRTEKCTRCMIHHVEHCMFAPGGNCVALHMLRAEAVARMEAKRRAAR